MSKTVEEVIALLNQTFPMDDEMSVTEMELFCKKNCLRFGCGETRFCIYDLTWGVVLKIARFGNVDTDYNEIEYNNYLSACELGIQKIFLPIRPIAVLKNGIQIYEQTRYTCSQTGLPQAKSTRLHKLTQNLTHSKIRIRSMKNCYEDSRISSLWYKRAYQIYGKKFMKKFEQFTVDHSIGDLHSSNTGYLGKMPIILDFAGYFE